MTLLDIGSILIGLVLLVAGGEFLVRGAAALATKLGMSPLVVGLTVVAFATSAPELAVTLGAVIGGEPDLAVGNVVGSNIANVLLILGVSALILPLLVKVQLVRVDIPFMLAMSVLLFILASDGQVTTTDGFILFLLLILYISIAIIIGRRDSPASNAPKPGGAVALAAAARLEAEVPGRGPTSKDLGDIDAEDPMNVAETDIAELSEASGPWWRDLILVAFGVGLLVVGANALVSGATSIASALGVSELVIGLTVVAIGTSLPELATSIVAVRRGQRDLAVGNVVGSNIFNIGAVMGLAGIFSPSAVPVPESALALDLPLMIAAAVALLPIAFTGSKISRWEGGLFVGLYLAYMIYLVLAAGDRPQLQGFTSVMLWFVTPLVVLTLVSTAAYEVGRRKQAGHSLLEPIDEVPEGQ